RGVRRVDRDAVADQRQERTPLRRGVGEALDGAKEDRVMGDDELRLFRDGLGGDLRRDGQAGHDPAHVGAAFAEQQADVVPVGGERRRGERFEELRNGGYGRHGGASLVLEERNGDQRLYLRTILVGSVVATQPSYPYRGELMNAAALLLTA